MHNFFLLLLSYFPTKNYYRVTNRHLLLIPLYQPYLLINLKRTNFFYACQYREVWNSSQEVFNSTKSTKNWTFRIMNNDNSVNKHHQIRKSRNNCFGLNTILYQTKINYDECFKLAAMYMYSAVLLHLYLSTFAW